MAAPSMDAIAEKYADKNVGSIFLYSHEAHPAENYGHLTSFEQKLDHGAIMRDVGGVRRSILVDALDGACHRYFGSMPNMTWVLNKIGTPLYKSDWTDVFSLENALTYFLDVAQRRRDGQRLAPFQVERLDYRNQDRDAFYRGLARNGQRAVDEFDNAFD